MVISKQKITEGLDSIDACWAVRSDKYIDPNDGYDARPSYHIHPDRFHPHQDYILRFYSLHEIERYIQAVQEAGRNASLEDGITIMDEFWSDLMEGR